MFYFIIPIVLINNKIIILIRNFKYKQKLLWIIIHHGIPLKHTQKK